MLFYLKFMKNIIVSGPVIIKNGKLLVSKDNKDDFYKIPGGRVEEDETLEECAKREFKEETGLECEIIKTFLTQKLTKRLGTNEIMNMSLHHYKAKLTQPIKNYNSFNYKEHKIKWLDLKNIEKENIAPNIKFLIEKGEIKL